MTHLTEGRWSEILPALGLPSTALNGKNQPCPSCGGKDRFRYTDKDGNGRYFCSQCGPGNGFSLLMKVHGWDFDEALSRVKDFLGDTPKRKAPRQEPRKMDNRKLLRDLWLSSRPVEHMDPVDRYLLGRGIATEAFAGAFCGSAGRVVAGEGNNRTSALRYVPEAYHTPNRTSHPCMIATISDINGKPALLHRTYLTEDGYKAAVAPQRMLMPGEFPKGGAIRLSEPAAVMGVAEGIETALSATILFNMPVWSVVAEGYMRTWEPPPGAKRVAIFGDNDENHTGQSAAYDLAKRLSRDGLDVSVYIPEVAGKDWNDVLREDYLCARAA